MWLPSGFRFRPARDEDVAPAAALASEASLALCGFRDLNEERLHRFWTAPTVDRDRDVAIVEAADGTLAGLLFVIGEHPFVSVFAIGIVGTPFLGRGIGAALVADNERRARRFLELAPPERRVVIHAGALADEPRVSALLEASGYREVRRFQLMRIEFDGRPDAPVEIPGLELRRFAPGDEQALFEAHTAAFADHWGEEVETFEDFSHHVFRDPGFDPALWFLAWDGDVVAGYAGVRLESDEDPSLGYVSLLGVVAAYRRRGLGEALLRHALVAVYDHGKTGCDLHVDAESLTGATRLYERAGMSAHPRFATWEKELRPGAGSSSAAP